MQIITESSTIAKCHREFRSRLADYASEIFTATIGGPGFSSERRISYSRELGIWWVFSKGDNRYWNAFGIGNPSDRKNTSVVCEINYPIEGSNGRVAAAFAHSDSGQIILLHSGKMGGGRIGVGKGSFWRHFVGRPTELALRKHTRIFAPLGELSHPRFPFHVALFVQEIDRIKRLVTSTSSRESSKAPCHMFNPEFSGKKNYRHQQHVEAACDHGLVVNTLRDVLNARGCAVANDQNRDLYILLGGRISTLFEIKTGADTQSWYTAVGQLLLNNPIQRQRSRLVLVLPEHPTPSVRRRLDQLGIHLLSYSWNRGIPRFTNVSRFIK